MNVEDWYFQGRRWWVRLHEKGGKRHEMPAIHSVHGRNRMPITSSDTIGSSAVTARQAMPFGAREE
jgi:hypothetical protein